MTKVYLDIETVPTEDQRLIDYIAQGVKAPGNIKKAETLAKWEVEDKPQAVENALQSASFDGCFNNIICIGYAFDDEPAQTVYAATADREGAILKEFFDALEARLGFISGNTFIGHNILGFDLRVIKHRSIILGIRPPAYMPFDGKPWERNPYDTMTQWDFKNSPKLEKLAVALGIEGKTMDGSQVYPLWLAQEAETIREYCAADVELTRKVYKRIEFLSPPELVVKVSSSEEQPRRLNLY